MASGVRDDVSHDYTCFIRRGEDTRLHGRFIRRLEVHGLTAYVTHYHHERTHQGKDNVLLFPSSGQGCESQGPIQCRERLGGLLKYYEREAA